MSTASGPARLAPVLGAALVWLLLAVCVGYWALRWWGQAPAQVLPAAAAPEVQIDTRRVAQALGALPAGTAPASAATPVAAPAAAGLRLVGVLSSAQGQGAALIGVGGQAPKPFRVGAAVNEGLVLQVVGPRHAELGPALDGPSTLRLDLPPPGSVPATPAAPLAPPPPGTSAGGFVPPQVAPQVAPQVPVLRPMPAPQAAD